jgi:hypothetical protein
MKIEHMILCRDTVIDRDRNTLSVFDVVEDLAIKAGGKVAIIPFHLLAVFRRDNEVGEKELEFELVISNPSGKELVKLKLPMRIEAKHRRSRLRINGTFPVDSSGDYTFTVSGSGGVKAEAILGVNFEWIEGVNPSV